MLILNGKKDLGLVHMTAECMTNSGVSKGAQRAVEQESVVVKGQEVIALSINRVISVDERL